MDSNADAAESGDPTGPGPRSSRVLIVDDHPMNVDLLARHLKRLGYAVSTAESGRAALERIARTHPDVVLLDVMMPDISGLDVLRRLRADPATVDLSIILVSGLDQTEDVVEGLMLGANDYVTKPINLPILEARLATQSALKASRDDLKQSALQLSNELDRHARDLQVASHVQRSTLPRTPPPSERLATAWCYEPATEVGGDLFDIVPLGDDRMLLFIADAMGHGVQAALVASTVKATLAAHLRRADDLSRLMAKLDEAMGDLFDDRFVTAAACVIDLSAHQLRYAVAGHPPVLVAGPSGVAVLETDGLPLGAAVGWGYEEGASALEPGSAILLYSDGVTEVEGPSGDQFGTEALIELLGRHRESDPVDMVHAIRSALDDFRGPVPLRDDLTILAARMLV